MRRAVTIDELRALCVPTVRALGLFHHLVPAKSIVDITAIASAPTRIRRLMIPASIASDFMIHDLKILNMSQFGRTGIPGDVFAEAVVDIGLKVDFAPTGSDVVISVEYVGNEADGAIFQGALLGTNVDGGRIVLPLNSFDPIRPSMPEIVTIDLDEDRYHFVIRANQLTALSKIPEGHRGRKQLVFGREIISAETGAVTSEWSASAHAQRSFEPPLPIALHVAHFSEVPYTVLYGIDEATDRVVLEVGEGMASNNRPFSARCAPEGYVPEWWNWRSESPR